MTIKHLYPTTRPVLNLDFAKTKRLDPRITFSRSSSASYVDANGVIQSAATNVARFDHSPVTEESLGLLVEEARTNLVTYSQEFDNAAWSKINGATVTANTATAPDGTLTADSIIPTVTSSSYIVQSPSVTSGTVYNVSWYVKAGALLSVRVGIGNAFGDTSMVVNLSTGQVTTAPSGAYSYSAINAGNGWWRIGFTKASSGTGVGGVYCAPLGTANGADGIYAWGAQLEAGYFSTSYIPTTTATVTRAADVVQITGTNFSSWYNQSEGTLAVEAPNGLGALGPSSNFTYLGISTGALQQSLSSGNGIKYGSGSPGNYTRVFVVAGGITAFDNNSLSNPSKVAIAYKQDNFAIARAGTLALDTSGNVPSGMDTLTLRGFMTTSYKRLAYWPTRLSDATLQAITS